MKTPPCTPNILYRDDGELSRDQDRALRRLLCESFPLRLSFRWRRHLGVSPQHRWLALSGAGEIVAHAAVFDRKLGTKSGPIAVGGVAQVCVHPAFRGYGLARAMLDEIHDWLARRERPFSILFGNPAYYRSSGYREARNRLVATNALLRRWNPFRGKLLIRPLAAHSWPTGEIDLRGPSF